MLPIMTTLVESWPEPNPDDIARRLRMYMGDVKLSRNKLAMASGMGRTALSAKLDGQVDFTVSELVAISKAIGRSWLWVATGQHDGDDGNGPDDGGVRPKGFEPLTFWSAKSATVTSIKKTHPPLKTAS